MHNVRLRAAIAALAVSALTLGTAALAAGPAASAGTMAEAGHAAAAAPAAPGAPADGGCQEVFQPPSSWVVVCGNGNTTGGGPGHGGHGGKYTCTLTPLSKAQISFFNLPKPPKGKKWAAITCPGKQPFGGITLVSGNGVPAVTPQELLQVAMNELTIPVLKPGTAPPRGREGLTGLPEWYWIPNGWRPVKVTVSAGPVYATVTATPDALSFDPGGGLGGSSCAGPGAAYRQGARTACSYTYNQSSATQPGGAYAASVTVTWRVTWTGWSPATGQVGGVLRGALPIAFPFALRVAEGQALVTGNGAGR
jgi:hypothetical protein